MSEIKKTTTFSPIQVVEFKISQYQKKGTKTATLKQYVETESIYPAVQLNDGLSAAITPTSSFTAIGEGRKFTNKETRTHFHLVPENYTLEQLQNDIIKADAQARANGSQLRIVKRMSNNVATLLTDGQKSAITNGLKKLEDYAKSMVCRFGKDHVQSGQLILDSNGNPQYRDMVLSMTKELTDTNTCGNGDCYIPDFLKAEMQGNLTFSDQVNVLFPGQEVETLKF